MKNGHLADDLAEIWHFYPDENIVEMELLLERKTAAVNIFTCSPKPPLRSIKSEKKKNADTVSDIFVGTASTARTRQSLQSIRNNKTPSAQCCLAYFSLSTSLLCTGGFFCKKPHTEGVG